MLKQNITYTDFDDNEVEETLYFNLTKTELMDQFDLMEELEALQKIFDGPQRKLTMDEVRRMLELIKTLMRMSYGVRSEDGKRFVKTDEIWTEFTQTPAYDEFLYSLFDNPNKGYDFLVGIMPKDIREQAAKEFEKRTGQKTAELYSDPNRPPFEANSAVAPPAPETPAWVLEGREPTQAEVAQMSPAEFDHYRKTQK